MIGAAVEREIRALLVEGSVSQRKIAQRLGVSRGTVNAIACDRRPDYAAQRQEPPTDWIPPNGLPARCPGCGGLVQMPCLACHIRAIMRRRSDPLTTSGVLADEWQGQGKFLSGRAEVGKFP
ncbi:MAG TPA: winged helix-turn-helix transcriptional regulator [Thermoguttaceae bacterium]|nr:winged helix-turn-helix transcriptional regulator [Thermoguttaceae bacterium]